jgi:hypothetical protein
MTAPDVDAAACLRCGAEIRLTGLGWGHVASQPTRRGATPHAATAPAHAKEEAMGAPSMTITVGDRSVTVEGDPVETMRRMGIAPIASIGDFVPSEEVRAVAERLMAREDVFRRLFDHSIAYLIDRRPAATSTKTGVHALAEVRITPKLWRDLAGVDAAIVVRRSAWDALTDHQREALVHHELMHLDENEKGGLVLRDHDLEEFGATVRAYGQWMPDIEHFAEQLRLFDSAAA